MSYTGTFRADYFTKIEPILRGFAKDLRKKGETEAAMLRGHKAASSDDLNAKYQRVFMEYDRIMRDAEKDDESKTNKYFMSIKASKPQET